jgi:hypothetical protein
MTKINAKIKLTILATLGHKLMGKDMDDLANALQEIIKEEVITAYNVGKHDALDNIEITGEEYYDQK